VKRLHLITVILAGLILTSAVFADEALTKNRKKDWAPQISPDGKLLVFMSDRGAPDLWMMDLATRKETQLTRTPEREKAASFSPKGTRVAFLVLRDLRYWVKVLDLPSGKVSDLGEGNAAAWSPNGQQIASRDAKGIFTINAKTGARRRIVNASRAGTGSIRWSRKGDALYYLHEGNIWKTPLSGGKPAMLYSAKLENSQSNFIHLEISRDEKRILTIVDMSRLSIKFQDQGMLLTEKGRKKLGPMFAPMWTPDGKYAIFCAGGNVYRRNPSESKAVLIGGEDNSCTTVVVSRDGKWAYFAARNPERRASGGRIMSKYTEIYRVSLGK
jgi:Tol biopolymer transport system component